MAKRPTPSSPAPEPHHPTHAAVTERDAAIYIGMSPAFLAASRLGRGSPGPAFIRSGRTIRYLLVDLDAWLLARRVTDWRSPEAPVPPELVKR